MGELNMRHSHATHDLYNRIRDGNPPVWTWYVQTMPVSADPAEVGFDPLDDTKVIPCLSQASCYMLIATKALTRLQRSHP